MNCLKTFDLNIFKHGGVTKICIPWLNFLARLNIFYSRSLMLVFLAEGPYLIPFRTQKLSPPAAMVLQG